MPTSQQGPAPGANDRRLLVIGGSGFFGKSILDAFHRGLLNEWQIGEVVVVARHASQLSKTHPGLAAGVRLIDADVATATSLPEADIVIHAATSTDASRYVSHAAEERANILAATDNFCAIARGSLPNARIVYCSSGAAYGEQPADCIGLREDMDLGDIGELAPYKRDYAEAKRMAEARIASLGKQGLRVSVARCFAFVGVHLPRDQHFAIGNFLGDGLAHRPIVVKANRPVVRSYMHADDLVRWLMTIADHATLGCPLYNVGSDEAVTVQDLAQRIASRCDVALDRAEETIAKPDRYVPDVAKARRELGLDLRFTLDSAISDMLDRLSTA